MNLKANDGDINIRSSEFDKTWYLLFILFITTGLVKDISWVQFTSKRSDDVITLRSLDFEKGLWFSFNKDYGNQIWTRWSIRDTNQVQTNVKGTDEVIIVRWRGLRKHYTTILLISVGPRINTKQITLRSDKAPSSNKRLAWFYFQFILF